MDELEVQDVRDALARLATAGMSPSMVDHVSCALSTVAVSSGMRAGELMALTWDDIDPERATPRQESTPWRPDFATAAPFKKTC